MKEKIEEIKNRILNGESIDKDEALLLGKIDNLSDIEYLCAAANNIREKFQGNYFELCTIVNGKSGACSEDCTYCAQSIHYSTNSPVYSLMKVEEIYSAAKSVENEKVDKFSIVTSGRGLKAGSELENLKNTYQYLRENTTLKLCASHGIIDYMVAKALKEVGVTTYHHNLESSRDFYPSICTTHSYDERVNTLLAAKDAGLLTCSGGIFGLGESIEDRIELAFTLRDLDVDSIPLNILMAIPGTPLEKSIPLPPLEIIKSFAIFRFINPSKQIRFAGGRLLLGEYEKLAFQCGINAAITGNLLTTVGSTPLRDRSIGESLGYNFKK